MVLWWKPVLAAVAGLGTLHAILHHNQDRINLFFMKFFRDLGRYKALKRRILDHGRKEQQSKGLLAFLASDADPLQDLLDLDAEKEDELHLTTYTRDELWQFGNHESEDGSLLLAILGRVYDVTEGDKYYGPRGTYGHFAGRDVTYALATGCKSQQCVETDWTKLSPATTVRTCDDPGTTTGSQVTAVFNDKQLLEAKKWLSFFHLHDKYPLVGKLEGDSFEDLIQQLLSKEQSGITEGGPVSPIPALSKDEADMLEGMKS